MKSFPRMMWGVFLGASFVASAFAQAPSRPYDPSAPKTRAEVKADLAEWLAAGYDPNDWLDYPDNALRAGRIVAAQRAKAAGPTSQHDQ
jgi:Domain of unknown function (DUF4148)